jgi:hypothetical protein
MKRPPRASDKKRGGSLPSREKVKKFIDAAAGRVGLVQRSKPQCVELLYQVFSTALA